MNFNRAIRLAQQWSDGYLCPVARDEAKEYHKICYYSLVFAERNVDEFKKMIRELNCDADTSE